MEIIWYNRKVNLVLVSLIYVLYIRKRPVDNIFYKSIEAILINCITENKDNKKHTKHWIY